MRNAPVILVCLCGLLLSFSKGENGNTKTSRQENIISLWSFDDDIPGFAIDKYQNKQDSLFGKYEYVQGVQGKAIKLDGFRTFAKRQAMNQQSFINSFSVEAWIAPAVYPWSYCPVFDCSDQSQRGFSFGIDNLGRVGFSIGAGSSWYEVKSELGIPLREWSHIAASYKSEDQIIVFINGENVGSLNIDGSYIASRSAQGFATIGRNKNSETWNEFQLSTPDTYFFLDGLLDEISISSRAITGGEIKEYIAGLGELPKPVLSERGNFPKGPEGSGTFGAYYSKLDYYKEWDDMWRVGDKPDVFVRFDGSPVQLVFWRGTSFVPCWVSENDIWYTNEWLETWGSDVVSCAEPIMDRDCRYSHVRIIENNDARAVIHWRYALSDAFYDFAAVSDDGRGEWCDEYHIIYPDNVGIRKMELHYSKPERKHDWVEQIVLTPPGIYPGDIIEEESISLINMKGEIKDYTWNDKLEIEMPEPKGANISYVNLKSEYRPFFIIPPGPVKTVEGEWDSPWFRTYAAKMAMNGYSPNPAPTAYGWWNHWPVAQIPGDGRWIVTPDRPGHFNLTTFVQWNDHNKTERTRTRIMLQGMTNEAAGELVPLAKSWLNAPEMIISSAGFEGGKYDAAERAYSLEKTSENAASLEVTIKGSEESPIINPAIIIKNWGEEKARVLINGKAVQQEDAVRQGVRSTPYGDDLILWFRMKSNDNVDISLRSAEKLSEKPNIVMIVIDDMGWGDIGYNSDDILSPNLDNLAKNGVKFTHHYVNQECTPTRVSLMTGRFPNRFGVHCSSASNDQAFPFETLTLAKALQSRGYNTALSGKWHLGSLPEWGPLKYGFNHSYGSLAGAVGMYDHRYRLNREPYTRTWHRNDEYIDEEGHVYDLVTDNAIDLIENTFTKEEPFFLYLPYQGVHTPLVEPQEWIDHNKHIENPSRQLFAAAVSHLDHQIGRVIESLEKSGQRDNTLVIVMSDNGGFPNYSGGQYPPPDPKLTDFSSNGPFRGQKGQPYEGGIRVPAFVNWPGTLDPGVTGAVVHAVDWLPTLSKLINYEPEVDQQWDGQDIWPFITGEKSEYENPRLLYWNYWNARIALRYGDWKIVSPTEGAPFELYNLERDPNETTDLSGIETEQFDLLMKKLEETRALDRKGQAPWLE